MYKLIKQIILVRKLRFTHLDVTHFGGGGAFWDMEADVDFMRFLQASNYISGYPIIKKLLKVVGAI